MERQSAKNLLSLRNKSYKERVVDDFNRLDIETRFRVLQHYKSLLKSGEVIGKLGGENVDLQVQNRNLRLDLALLTTSPRLMTIAHKYRVEQHIKNINKKKIYS